MILNDKSPFRQLPAGLPREQILFLDGIRYSIEITALAYGRLWANTAAMSKAMADQVGVQDLHSYTAALSDAWTMIDSTHRLRELIWDMPGLAKKQRSVELRKFRGSTASIETLRHKVQHLKGEIRALAGTDQPVWGILSWVSLFEEQPDIVRICRLAAGTLSPYFGPPTKLEKMWLTPPVDRLELTAHGISVSLTGTYQAVERVARALEEALQEAFKTLPKEAPPAGGGILACLELKLGAEAEPRPNV
jgi:hypothetical protein